MTATSLGHPAQHSIRRLVSAPAARPCNGSHTSPGLEVTCITPADRQ
jgi:hypothetical protein